jgi:hypothetical protein
VRHTKDCQSVGAVVREKDRHFINHYAESRGETAASCQLRMVADEPAQNEENRRISFC